jgi:ferredoxin
MPNNVCNFFLTPLESEKKVAKYLAKADYKMQIVCSNIKAGVVKKRGFNIFSRILGLPQGVFVPLLEKRARKTVKVNENCTQCGLCVSICPVNNLTNENGAITHRHNCVACYRCVNKCPAKAITALYRGRVKRQYKGVF